MRAQGQFEVPASHPLLCARVERYQLIALPQSHCRFEAEHSLGSRRFFSSCILSGSLCTVSTIMKFDGDAFRRDGNILCWLACARLTRLAQGPLNQLPSRCASRLEVWTPSNTFLQWGEFINYFNVDQRIPPWHYKKSDYSSRFATLEMLYHTALGVIGCCCRRSVV